jgi:hypothetical protein
MAAGSPRCPPTENLHKRYARLEAFPCQCLAERKLEATNRLDDKTTTNKFRSFLVAVLAVTKVSAFMGQPCFGQQQVLAMNLVAVMFESRMNIGNR